MKPIAIVSYALFAYAAVAFAATSESPTGNRTTPPTISAVSPMGVARGATVEMDIEGFNLAKTSAVFFSEAGIRAKILRIKELPDLPDIRLGANGTVSTIDLGPLPPRNQVTLELDISPDAAIGIVNFRLQTPLGTTPEARFVVDPYYGEAPDREPNDTAEEGFETFLPAILVGAISKPGDVDFYKIAVHAGERVVFENSARQLGSALQPVISIYDAGQKLLKQFTEDEGRRVNAFAYDFAKAGTYYIRISDYEEGGSAKHFYRIRAGKLPIATAAFPLGLERGKTAEISFAGYNLANGKVAVQGAPSEKNPDAAIVRPKTPSGPAFDDVVLALGKEPEVFSTGKNVSITATQLVTPPVTVNGKMLAPENDFRFHAIKDEKLILDVAASRLGSPLDSLIEVLDAAGKPLERATIKCLIETSTTLRDHDSAGPGIRITSPAGFEVGDYVLIGSDIIRLKAMPRGPDDDAQFEQFGGQRIAYFDTTAEAHALDSPVYKVQVLPPGSKVTPNGLPVVHLMYRNDDGGPGWGKDSLLHFTAPADGDYVVRITDVRGAMGDQYAYRLTLRRPDPDFRLTVSPANPNVPAGGRVPLTVTAMRLDDYDGPIHVAVKNLPAGLHATSGVIEPGQVSTTLILSADEDAKLDRAVPLVVADDKGRMASPEDKLKLIALAPKPDINMNAETKEVVLEPGGKATVEVSINRNNDFGGRVPVEVRNLPPGVLVTDVGLNGVLINENEQKRSFTLLALPNAEPVEQPIVVSGLIETRAGGQQNSFAAEPVKLIVKPANRSASRQ